MIIDIQDLDSSIFEFESLRANFLNIDGNLHTKNL